MLKRSHCAVFVCVLEQQCWTATPLWRATEKKENANDKKIQTRTWVLATQSVIMLTATPNATYPTHATASAESGERRSPSSSSTPFKAARAGVCEVRGVCVRPAERGRERNASKNSTCARHCADQGTPPILLLSESCAAKDYLCGSVQCVCGGAGPARLNTSTPQRLSSTTFTPPTLGAPCSQRASTPQGFNAPEAQGPGGSPADSAEQ